jgi:hypothetical protein
MRKDILKRCLAQKSAELIIAEILRKEFIKYAF